MTREKATVLAKKFLEWVTDENGEPKEELIDHIYEDIDLVPGYSVFIYVDYEEEGSPELDDYWRGICTYVDQTVHLLRQRALLIILWHRRMTGLHLRE